METLDQQHKQLDILKELHTLVRTMKALSAANIRQYELATKALAGYYQTIEHGLHVVLRDMEPSRMTLLQPHQPLRLAAIIFGSDHGLCGRFNEEIAEFALAHLESTPTDPENRLFLAVGARVAASLEHAGQAIEENFLVPGSASQITATVQQILLKVDEWREQTGIHYVYLFYHRHIGSKHYAPTSLELLPINLRHFHSLWEKRWPSRSLPLFTLPRETLLSRLLHQYLFVSIFRACAESQASEHSSRMLAMQAAERNLDERLEEVTILFRRARQNEITAELLDIVAGYEALTGRK